MFMVDAMAPAKNGKMQQLSMGDTRLDNKSTRHRMTWKVHLECEVTNRI